MFTYAPRSEERLTNSTDPLYLRDTKKCTLSSHCCLLTHQCWSPLGAVKPGGICCRGIGALSICAPWWAAASLISPALSASSTLELPAAAAGGVAASGDGDGSIPELYVVDTFPLCKPELASRPAFCIVTSVEDVRSNNTLPV